MDMNNRDIIISALRHCAGGVTAACDKCPWRERIDRIVGGVDECGILQAALRESEREATAWHGY